MRKPYPLPRYAADGQCVLELQNRFGDVIWAFRMDGIARENLGKDLRPELSFDKTAHHLTSREERSQTPFGFYLFHLRADGSAVWWMWEPSSADVFCYHIAPGADDFSVCHEHDPCEDFSSSVMRWVSGAIANGSFGWYHLETLYDHPDTRHLAIYAKNGAPGEHTTSHKVENQLRGFLTPGAVEVEPEWSLPRQSRASRRCRRTRAIFSDLAQPTSSAPADHSAGVRYRYGRAG